MRTLVIPHSNCPPCFPHKTSESEHKRIEDLGTQFLVFHCSAETELQTVKSLPAAEQGKSTVFKLGNFKSWELQILQNTKQKMKALLVPPTFQSAVEKRHLRLPIYKFTSIRKLENMVPHILFNVCFLLKPNSVFTDTLT